MAGKGRRQLFKDRFSHTTNCIWGYASSCNGIGSALGKEIQATMDCGALVSDAIIIELIKARIANQTVRFFIRWFSRTLSRPSLCDAGVFVDYVVEFGHMKKVL